MKPCVKKPERGTASGVLTLHIQFCQLAANADGRQVAGGSGIVYEIQMGMGDRGASLDWLSQCGQLAPS